MPAAIVTEEGAFTFRTRHERMPGRECAEKWQNLAGERIPNQRQENQEGTVMVTRKTVLAVALLVAVGIAIPFAVRRAAAAPAPEERHPVIHEAIEQLEHTRDILVHDAARDFKGHRAAAVRHIDQALRELHEALEADRH
jgi:hypothetical protein